MKTFSFDKIKFKNIKLKYYKYHNGCGINEDDKTRFN